jgi:hypothetical protein
VAISHYSCYKFLISLDLLFNSDITLFLHMYSNSLKLLSRVMEMNTMYPWQSRFQTEGYGYVCANNRNRPLCNGYT